LQTAQFSQGITSIGVGIPRWTDIVPIVLVDFRVETAKLGTLQPARSVLDRLLVDFLYVKFKGLAPVLQLVYLVARFMYSTVGRSLGSVRALAWSSRCKLIIRCPLFGKSLDALLGLSRCWCQYHM